MKTWTATLDISFTLTEKEIERYGWIRELFADPKNPTEEEIRKYFDGVLENYAGSNDGSELLANCDYSVRTEGD